ncbi:transposase, partial [Cylindrospermopsis raciborskii C03]
MYNREVNKNIGGRTVLLSFKTALIP